MTIPVVIIGAGPAGVAAAIQLQRNRIAFLLLEKDRIGGLLNEANRVENFPAVSGGASGRALAKKLDLQLRAIGMPIEKKHVLNMALRNNRFILRTSAGTISAGRVILACGTLPLAVPPPLDQETLRGRVFTSVLPLLKAGKKIMAIIGGGDAAFDYALSLAGKNNVHILVRSGRLRALPLLVERCRRHPNITIHENCQLIHATTTQKAAAVILTTVNPINGKNSEIACQQILTATGREPALGFLDPELCVALPDLAVRKKLFLAGDVASGRFRQAAIAFADGLRAAMEISAGGNECG